MRKRPMKGKVNSKDKKGHTFSTRKYGTICHKFEVILCFERECATVNVFIFVDINVRGLTKTNICVGS